MMILAGFVVGLGVALVAIGVYISLTFKCSSGPCDAGGMTGFALWLFGGPIVGVVFAYGVSRYIRRKERQWRDA
jgi:phosphotransferase system  glucose/maltose/N-acetylglucosamine-specific IIC component